MRRGVVAAAAGLTLVAGLGRPQGATGQVADVRAAAALWPDTVRVGQPFRLGVTVTAPRGFEIRFPAALELGENLEQVGEAEIGKRRALSGVSRAYYRVVAWTAGPHVVPPVGVQLTPPPDEAEPLQLRVEVPPLTVETVLPAEIEGLELRQALPYLRPLPFSLLLLLALIALLVGLWAYGRLRKRDEEPGETALLLTPWERALAELRSLAERWRRGEMAHDAFCDRLESVLRRYLAETEGWAPGMPTRAVVNGNRQLAHALEYSARVRFARLGGGYGGPIEASDACRAWIVSRHEVAAGEPAGEDGGAP